jgi:nucleoside-diphosphate-sugar epimerase
VGQHFCQKLERIPDLQVYKVKFDEIWDLPVDLKADFIIHNAGYGQPLKFTVDKIKTININTKTTNDLFEHFLKPDGKFLFVSTSEVYSGAKAPYTERSIGTTTPQHPRACYIEGKRCGEAIVMAHREQGIDAKIARLSLAYGEGTKKDDTRVINQFIQQALETGKIQMRDDGSAQRVYCYIDDAVDMMLEILFKGTQPVYNVGGKDKITIAELAQKIAEQTDAEVYIGDKGLNGAPEDTEMSIGLVTTEFPRTFVSLEEGLKRTINYQRQLYGK